MAIIPQQNLFSWEKIESTSDLHRLKLVLNFLPDEKLMIFLEEKRGKGRNDYPIRAIWNSIIAGIIYQHSSIESLRRELSRNGELRQLCGFDIFKGMNAVPSSSSYTHFLKQLFYCEDFIEEMFNLVLTDIKQLLPDLGKHLAVDSKAISSYGNKNKKKTSDGRRDTDANYGIKKYFGINEGGKPWETIKSWFGYKIHLIVDSEYELPLASIVTKASISDGPQLLPLLEKLNKTHPEIIETSEYLTADKGYDSSYNNEMIFEEYEIKPVIDIRSDWNQGDKLRLLNCENNSSILVNSRGNLYCDMGKDGEFKPISMPYCGFEKNRKSLKYICPASRSGTICPQAENETCWYKRVIRIKLDENRRRFVPIPRDSPKWNKLYAKRSGVERVNSRISIGYGFDHHFIRGMKKMKLRLNLALLIMLTMAYGSIMLDQKERMRSLTRNVPLKKAA